MNSRKEEKALYYKKNRKRILARSKDYDKAHRERKRTYLLQWRARKRLKNLTIKTRESKFKAKNDRLRFGGNREKTIQRDKEQCVVCQMTRQEHWQQYGKDITVNHINGKGRNAKEKDHSLENLETLCLKCHGLKDKQRQLQYE